jgi:hypothetical protein
MQRLLCQGLGSAGWPPTAGCGERATDPGIEFHRHRSNTQGG